MESTSRGAIPDRRIFAVGTKSVTVFVATILAGVLWFFFKATAVAIAIETALDKFFDHMGWERGKMIVAAAPFVAMIGVAYAIAFISYRLGEAEKSNEPIVDIDPRRAFKNIIENKVWREKNIETNPEKRQRLVSNYLQVRLDRQIHDLLAQGKLSATGGKSFDGGIGPSDWIPKNEWHNVEIYFDGAEDGRLCVAHHREHKELMYVGIKLSSQQLAKHFRIRRGALFQ
jgi:hypothetical protein